MPNVNDNLVVLQGVEMTKRPSEHFQMESLVMFRRIPNERSNCVTETMPNYGKGWRGRENIVAKATMDIVVRKGGEGSLEPTAKK